MNVEDLTLELRGPQTGVSLFDEEMYIATYRSSFECVLDIIYRWGISDISGLFEKFNDNNLNGYMIEPFVYRGVQKCTGQLIQFSIMYIMRIHYQNYLKSFLFTKKEC